MRKLDHQNIVRLRYFFYSSGEKVSPSAITSTLFAELVFKALVVDYINPLNAATRDPGIIFFKMAPVPREPRSV